MTRCGRALVLVALLGLPGCSGFFFYPSPAIPYAPDAFGLRFEDVRIVASDGVDLAGWYLPAQSQADAAAAAVPRPTVEATRTSPTDAARPPANPAIVPAPAAPRPAILFLHGNGANMAAHLASIDWLPPAGYGVFVIDYRGYGRSAGSPSIEGVHRDARAALRYLASRPDVDRHRIAVFGQSLGASLAIDTAAELRDEVPVRAVIADSAFSDFRDITREKLGSLWFTWPFQWIGALTVPGEPSPLEEIRKLDGIPVLLLAGSADQIVPLDQSIRLYEAAPSTTELCVGEGAGHIEVFTDPHWRERLLVWLQARLGDTDDRRAVDQRSEGLAHEEAGSGAGRPAPLEPFCERRPPSASPTTPLSDPRER